MTVKTKSSFIYGYTVTSENFYLNFDEGTVKGELAAQFNAGSYSLSEFTVEIARALNTASDLPQEYTVSVDRLTRLITISSVANFNLLAATGTQTGSSIFSDMGFSSVDLTGATTYTGDLPAGKEYLPQFYLQQYVSFDNWTEHASASVNESAEGTVEIVSFGTRSFMEFNMAFSTDLIQGKGSVIDNNPTGVSDLREFMNFITDKNTLEFMEDKNDPNTFIKILLDKTKSNSKGTGFKLRELYAKGLAEFFETGILKFRKIL